MDRLDYLNRDSFYTGVAEGVIGYDRIITMLRVVNDHIVVEEKGIYSIEKFLIARKIMYWQVYLHKTVLSAEQMLIHFFDAYRLAYLKGKLKEAFTVSSINVLLDTFNNSDIHNDQVINAFCKIDDIDVYMLLKKCRSNALFEISYLANAILDRKLHKIEMRDIPFAEEEIHKMVDQTKWALNIDEITAKNLIFTGSEKTKTYDDKNDKINILYRNGEIGQVDHFSYVHLDDKSSVKCYFCYPDPYQVN
jgi:HD superfamily phosphohydrolase